MPPAVAFALVCLVGQFGQAEETTDKANDTTISQIRLAGQVIDGTRNAIDQAKVTLVAASDWSHRFVADLDPQRPWIQTGSDERGRFQLGFAADDQRFLLRGELLLIVQADGYQTHLKKLPRARLRVDVPIEVQLDPAEPVPLKVVNSEGQPVADVSVCAASINGVRIPWAVAGKAAGATTDSQGRVSLKHVTQDSIDGVFVVGPNLGHQRLTIDRSGNGDLQITTMRTRPVNGQITSPEQDPIPGINDVKMFVTSRRQHGSNPLDGPMLCSWAIASITNSGSFQVESIGLGQTSYQISCPDSFPFRDPNTDQTISVEAGVEPYIWRISFLRRVKLKAKVIDAISGNPLPNIHIASWDGRIEPTFTNAKGEAEFYRQFNHVSYFPFDATDKFFSADGFYRNTKKMPVNGRIDLEPAALVRSSSWRGTVVDQQGHPVAGAKVEYEYSLERYNQSAVAYSDSKGNFRLGAVADRTAVKLHAVKDHAASDAVTVLLPPKEDSPLKLIPRPSARPTGRVVDMAGKPIAGVAVTVKRANVTQKEHYGREELLAVELYPSAVRVRTDLHGKFEFPVTIEYARRLQIQILDQNCFPFYSPFIDGSKIAKTDDAARRTAEKNLPVVAGASSSSTAAGSHGHGIVSTSARPKVSLLDLGDFQVMKRPASRLVTLLVTSPQGQPIADADIVVVGARTGTVRGTTNSQGQLRLNVRDGKAMIAIQAQGYHVYLAERPEEETSWNVVLQTSTMPRDTAGIQSIWEVNASEFTDAAQKIFAPLERPDPKSTTLYRLRSYVDTLGSLDPDECVRYILINLPMNPQLAPYALAGAQKALVRKPELIELLVKIPFVPADVRCSGFLIAAKSTDDPDLQDEWLGEALVAVRSLSGRQRLYSMARMAQGFAASGRMDLARQVVDELWSHATDLQEIIKSGKRQEMAGESRMVGPVLAIIDLEQATKLIELTAREVAIARLQTEAMLNWAQANPEELAARLRDGSLGPLEHSGVGSWLYANSELAGPGQGGLSKPVELSRLIGDAKTRLRFLAFHARVTTDRELRHELLRLAVTAVRECAPDATRDHYSLHCISAMLPELRRFKEIDPEDLDPLIFSALWNLPPQFETDQLHAILGGAAQLVALRDRRLARTMLEPCFQDLGWLFMGRQLGFRRNKTLNAIAHIDPQWSVEIVGRLCEQQLQHDTTDQLDLRCGMVDALISSAQ